MVDMDDVLRKKDGVTKGSRGLQIWSDASMTDEGDPGTAGSGTSQRQGNIGRGQREKP